MPTNTKETSDIVFIKGLLDISEEHHTLEFKRLSEPNVNKRILETIISFANVDGGLLILGIADPEKSREGEERVFGIEENQEAYDALAREIPKIIPPLANIWPPVLLQWSSGKHIAVIHVPKCTEEFRSWNGDVYVREQKSIRRLSPQEVICFAYAKGFRYADRELVDVSMHLLNTDLYRAWISHRGLTGSIEEVFEKTGLARRESNGNALQPTRAAVLLFADFPSTLMDTKSSVRIMQYAGTREIISEVPNLIGSPETISGPIVQLIRGTQRRVLDVLRAGVKMPESGFVTQYRLPERAIKEAIVNAIIHRDYFTKRDVEIKIFEDRIEIENAGLLPFNITPRNIGFVRATGYRNDLLVKILREFPDPPNLDQNEGVRAMRSEMHTNNLYPPIYLTYPHLRDAVRVVLLNETAPSEWDKVQDYLRKNKYIKNSEARAVTGISDSAIMSRQLKRWVYQGLLIRVDHPNQAPKKVKYRLPNSNDAEDLLAKSKSSIVE